jgi:hypothetical protein
MKYSVHWTETKNINTDANINLPCAEALHHKEYRRCRGKDVLITYSMVQDILWRANNHLDFQTITSFLYGIRRFITVFTKSPPLNTILSQLNPVRPVDPYLRKVHLNVILPPTPRSSQRYLPFGPPNKNPVDISPLPHACHMTRPSHPPWFNHPNNIRWRIQVMKFIIMQFSLRCFFLPFRSKYPPQHSLLKGDKPKCILNLEI